MTCNCLTGTAYLGADGNCLCCEGVLLGGKVCTGGIKYPPSPNTPVNVDPYITRINCNRHQAPSGYKYVNENGYCVLMRLSDGYRMRVIAGSTIPQTALTVGDVAATTASNFTTWVQANKSLLTLLGVAAGAYYLAKKT